MSKCRGAVAVVGIVAAAAACGRSANCHTTPIHTILLIPLPLLIVMLLGRWATRLQDVVAVSVAARTDAAAARVRSHAWGATDDRASHAIGRCASLPHAAAAASGSNVAVCVAVAVREGRQTGLAR
jgi:hypothetical protein